ncbi:T9SS type A sorting domain-containing protein [Prevotella sp.]
MWPDGCVSTLQPGLYVLRTTVGGKSCSQRLVISR